MTKSVRKKNFKLRRRIQRTIAAVTMITAVVIAAIPVENYGTMRAEAVSDLGDITSDLNAVSPRYQSADYENNYKVKATVQRIIQDGDTLSLVDMFEVKKTSETSGNAIITKDIIGDGTGKTTELKIKSVEYCDYVQFDPVFIGAIRTALNNGDIAKKFTLTFEKETETTLTSPEKAPLTENLGNIVVKKIETTGTPKSDPVDVQIKIPSDNKNNQGYNTFPAFSGLDSKDVYDQFGEKFYDTQMTTISNYNKKVDDLIKKVDNLKSRTSSADYVWKSSDTNEWNVCQGTAADLQIEKDTARVLSTAWTEFDKKDNGLNVIVDYIIRNYCKKGNSELVDFQLKSLLKNEKGDNITVYVPQYTKSGSADWLDENKFLPATATSKVTIKGIASYTGSGDDQNKAFYETKLNTIVLPQGLEFIGKSAFGHSDLMDVTINTTTCKIIGEEAFADCSQLKKISFEAIGAEGTQTFMTIDKKAFYSTQIKEVVIPYSVTYVGAGAFANATSLETVTFENTGRTKDIEIEKFAFYNCTGLKSVSFPADNNSQYRIKRGAFAIKTSGGELNTFTFPGGNTDINYGEKTQASDYDYILANRSSLVSVTFPGKLGSTIPDNTLSGCNNLAWVKFPENAKRADYDPDKLFLDVWGDPAFYVEGPEILDEPKSKSKPRVTTWKAKAGKTSDGTWALTSVPYKFEDKDKKVHFEIGVKDDVSSTDPQYIANIEKIGETATAKLVSYSPYSSTDNISNLRLNIPTNVGGCDVVSIEAGCFDNAKKLKDNITRLTIGDSVQTISAGAFEGMPKLQWVDIGAAVKKIESKAFAECKKLENVVFKQSIAAVLADGDNAQYLQELMTIADDAFKTNSERLTFHGVVDPEYAPFKLAMSEKNSDLLSTDAQICYKTDAPLNLTVIRNRKDGKATLVNYPHYEDMDTDARKMFEDIYIKGTEQDQNKLDSDAADAILQTLHMELPEGIESIDAKSFFDAGSKNNPDYNYIDHYYEQKELVKATDADGNELKDSDGKIIYVESQVKSDYQWTVIDDKNKVVMGDADGQKKDLKSLYSQDKYAEDNLYAKNIGNTAYEKNTPSENKSNFIVSTGGLFSGGFYEGRTAIDKDSAIWEDPYEGHTYKELFRSGNDYLTSINMPTVKELPKYAFDSCENLLTVKFNAVESMGDLPFRGCKNLYHIDPGQSKYVFQNMLLYEKKPDGSYELVECLEGRGKSDDYLESRGNRAADDVKKYYYTPSITSKGEGTTDDMLRNVTSIKEGAFSNCREITSVNLEESKITKVPQRAFENCEDLFQVVLPETTRGIGQQAFKGVESGALYVTIKSPNCSIAADAFDFSKTKEVYITGVPTDKNGDESTTHFDYETIKNELKTNGKDENRIHFNELGSQYTLTFSAEGDKEPFETMVVDKGKEVKPPTPPTKEGKSFSYWMCTSNPKLTEEEMFKNITEDRIYMAIYKEDKTSFIPDGKEYNLTVYNAQVWVDGKLISGEQQAVEVKKSVKSGSKITMLGNTSSSVVWTAELDDGDLELLSAKTGSMTTFTMPNRSVTFTANLTGGSTGGSTPGGSTPGGSTPGGSTPGGSTPGGNPPPGSDSTTKYKLTVNYGKGGGEYAAGTSVTITADPPDSSRREFSRWTTSNSALSFGNTASATTTIVMPASEAVVTANYRVKASADSDDEDSGSTGRRPGTIGSTTTTAPGSSTSTTGTTNTSTNTAGGNTAGSSTAGSGTAGGSSGNSTGSRIYITKNGVSNVDIASVSVSGATDNFIVRIGESPEATAAVEQALINRYGSLDGLAYFPMDISLYDATGQNRITDTTGLNITVTMPIPDVLIQYGGNARVGAADNGNLQQITPKFTTIDGIACISFIPPHFSPYVIYVDTNNLIAGQTLDATPSTGDPIHPKWFAAVGMACMSVILFATSGGKRRKNYRAA